MNGYLKWIIACFCISLISLIGCVLCVVFTKRMPGIVVGGVASLTGFLFGFFTTQGFIDLYKYKKGDRW